MEQLSFKTSLFIPREWRGVYPGQLERIIGAGGEGVVVSGCWHGEKAAFKFVPMRVPLVQDGLSDLATRLHEMTTMQSISGTRILKLLGHYR